jgi:hypothetical protein
MANSYYDATGVLILDRVTPVITALFGPFGLDASYPGNGQAYVARLSEIGDPQWSDVLDGLTNLAAECDLSTPDDDNVTMPWLLSALAEHFGTSGRADLLTLIEHHLFEGDVDLDALQVIASSFNDGHNLAAIEFEGAWHCSRPRLFEFGGEGLFSSQELRLSTSSTDALRLGRDLRKAILGGDLTAAAARITRVVLHLLAGVTDESLRARLRSHIGDLLLTDHST